MFLKIEDRSTYEAEPLLTPLRQRLADIVANDLLKGIARSGESYVGSS